ncbi:hypothetical protein DPMN_174086 [Dreissena polymorpha]|uniref:Uncharacterized protein n=3 Tax=Dreissena polymorpha TaxID=45954 RepID=A0A9D4E405_DREPO|nr:hypothetical protein DPMN_174086 [Dreissena polymorpha]
MRNEKKPLFRKEAQEEAKHFGMISNDQEALDLIDDDELIPSTSIDDVNISIIDDISEKHQRESPEKNKVSKTDFSKPDKVVSPSTEKQKVDKTDTSKPDKALSPSTEKQKINKTDSAKPDKAISPSNKNTKVVQSKESPNAKNASPDNRRAQSQSMTHKNHSSDSEKQRSDPPGKTDHKTEHNREPIHVQMGHADSGGKSLQMEDKQKDSLSKPSPGGQDETSPPSGTAGNPQLRHLQTEGEGKPVVRTASFQKKRESQRLRSLENHLATTAEGDESGRYTSGTNTGTLADLKKQRLEQHKFGSGTEGMVANLFLTSLSTDPRKYSSGTPSSTSAPPSKDKVQNGRSPRSNNNNNNNGQSRPPTFISDNGPLRRFSAPASAPVIGEDDKFKNDCCVIL